MMNVSVTSGHAAPDEGSGGQLRLVADIARTGRKVHMFSEDTCLRAIDLGALLGRANLSER